MVDFDEVLTNGHAGMLNDTHRHQAYRSAIRNTVRKMHSRGETVRLLDIGTGTGLLTLYAAEAGAEFIVACESNLTMANIAKSVIKENQGRYKGSCSIVIEAISSCDLDKYNPSYCNSFNVIVSEVYDSELVGEGCLITYRHALSRLAAENCIFIPLRATLFVQPIFSSSLPSYCSLPSHLNSQSPRDTIFFNFDIPWEVHVDKMEGVQYGEEVEVWHWEFDKDSFDCWTGSKNIVIPNEKLENGARCNGVIVWWSSDIDEENTITTAPSFHKDFQEFRDHWMPLIYFIRSGKSEINLKIEVTDLEINISDSDSEPAIETDMIPREMQQYRYIGFMNCTRLNNAYLSMVKDRKDLKGIVYIGPSGGLPVVIAELKRITDQSVPASATAVKSLAGRRTIVIDSCYDPFSLTSVSYFYKREKLEKSRCGTLCDLIPSKVVLFVTLVESSQLSNRVLSPNFIDGFDVSSFSGLVRKCLNEQTGDDMFDPVHLWEYEYKTLSTPVQVPSFQHCGDALTVTLPISRGGRVTNALFSLGFYFGEILIHFGERDYFSKVDCYTFVESFTVENGDNVVIDFKLRNCQIFSFEVHKS